MSNELDEKDLKILALQEANAELNDKFINLRVQYTIAMKELEGWRAGGSSNLPSPEVVEGEIVADN